MFSLLLLLTWGSSSTIANLAEVIDSRLDELSIGNWHCLFRSLKQAIEILYTGTEKERLTIDAETLPTNLSVKTVTALGTRANSGDALKLYQKYLFNYQETDSVVLEFCQNMAIELARTDPNFWQESLSVIAHSYAYGIIPSSTITRSFSKSQVEGLVLPFFVAQEIAQHPEKYPRSLTLSIEPVFKNMVDSHVIPVGNIAKEQHWFED